MINLLNMKKLYFFLTLLGFSALEAQVINFTDANFKAKLLQSDVTNSIAQGNQFNNIKIDANNNGDIEESEANAVFSLDVRNSFIANSGGLEFFNSLEVLDISDNQLTSLNINAPSLYTIRCNNNLITTLNLSNTNSSEVYVQNNQLTDLILPANTPLEYLNIRDNNLDGFDLTVKSPSISFYYGNNPNDTIVFPDNYPMSSNGGIFYTTNNATTLDLSYLKSFGADWDGKFYIEDAPNLVSVNFQNGYNNTTNSVNEGGNWVTVYPNDFYVTNCPNLNLFCCDAGEVDYLSSTYVLHTSNSISVNSNCSLSNQENSNSDFALFPNPTNDFLNIKLDNDSEITSIRVYNMLGQTILNVSETTNQVDVSNLASGHYYIQITTDQGISNQKIIKL